MKLPPQLGLRSRNGGGSLLGLSFDAGRLEGVVLRRTNGTFAVQHPFAVSLSLDPLTNAAELVGREIRNQLDAAGVRERRCVVCLPLQWALTLSVRLPDLAGADLESFLEIEAERGLPYGPDALMLARSCYRTPGGECYATLVAVPRDPITRLEAALRAAQLRPVSFSLGIAALPQPAGGEEEAVLALVPGENSVGLLVSLGGGLLVLRTMEGAFEVEGGERRLQADQVARETRITLGQLPADVRAAVRRVRVLGRSDAAEELAEALGPRLEPLGLRVERVRDYASDALGARLPAGTTVSAPLSLAAQQLAGRAPLLEFLPPKVTAWQQFASRHASRKLVWAGSAAGAIALFVLLAFLAQHWQLKRWQSKWAGMAARVAALEGLQQEIKKYRPWYDDTYRTLSILRCLTEAFPEDSDVTAKTIEIREASGGAEWPTVTCAGTARSAEALQRMLDKLSVTKGVAGLRREQVRGTSSLQFSFNFQWREGGGK